TTTTTITAPYFGLTGLSSSTSPWTPGVPPTAPAQEGTATCLCGAVHLAFPTTSPGLVASFVCYCIDCRKGGAEAGVVVKDDFLKHLRGTSNLCSYSQPVSTPSSHGSTTFFCQACGSNMYRVGTAFPGCAIVRLGTVDDARLVEGRLRPTRELCVKERASWACGVKGEDVKRRVGLFS
ncbi:Mss4-like protein, partial [Bipolaris maydis]